MMQSDQRAQLARCVPGKKSLQGPFRAEPYSLAGNLFDVFHELRIQRHARLGERHHRYGRGILRRGRQNPRARPGSFVAGVALVKHSDAQAGLRQFHRDRAANQPSAGNGHVESLHDPVFTRINYNSRYNEPTNSCESTSAFFAALRARIQSPVRAASRASDMKLRTLEARSCCAALSVLPSLAPIFRSAMPML